MPRSGAPGDGESKSKAAKALSGAELQIRRRGLGLTQAKLAKRLGVTPNTLARWERGELHPLHPEHVGRRLARLERAKGLPTAVSVRARPTQTSNVAPLRTNLPVHLSSFVGRERELAQVLRLLAATRLLCLSGPGGIGKTRLAIEAAKGLADSGADRVLLVELSGITDPDLVVGSVASVLRISERGDQRLIDTLAEVIGDHRVLLVLDNCEHVLVGCAELAAGLLRQCPELRILATSREQLGISGETVWRVPPLAVPDVPEPLALEATAQVDSMQLFLERARDALPDFGLTKQNLSAIAQLCRRLDGIPLALELAAARVPVLSVEQLLGRLDDALRLLVTGSRVAPQRQQTLRATLERSYGLLSQTEQLLFRRVSVFAGGWTLDAVEATSSDEKIACEDVLPLLARLVDKSLVLSEVRSDGSMRYRLLEPLRQFAAEQLRHSGETGIARNCHLNYFLARSNQAAVGMWNSEQMRWLEWFEAERDNLRAALGWCIESRQVSQGLRLFAALEFSWLGGRLVEGRSRLPALLAMPGTSTDRAALAWALGTAANVIRRFPGDRPVARAYAERALVVARQLYGESWIVVMVIGQLAWTALFMGDLPRAEVLFDEALELAYAVGPAQVARIMWGLGWLHVLMGDNSAGRSQLEQAMSTFQALGARFQEGQILTFLAELDIREGRTDDVPPAGLSEQPLALDSLS